MNGHIQVNRIWPESVQYFSFSQTPSQFTLFHNTVQLKYYTENEDWIQRTITELSSNFIQIFLQYVLLGVKYSDVHLEISPWWFLTNQILLQLFHLATNQQEINNFMARSCQIMTNMSTFNYPTWLYKPRSTATRAAAQILCHLMHSIHLN